MARFCIWVDVDYFSNTDGYLTADGELDDLSPKNAKIFPDFGSALEWASSSELKDSRYAGRLFRLVDLDLILPSSIGRPDQ